MATPSKRDELGPAGQLLLTLGLIWAALLALAHAPPLRLFGHELARAELAGWGSRPVIEAEPPPSRSTTSNEPRILSASPATAPAAPTRRRSAS